MRKPIERQIRRGAATAKASARKAKKKVMETTKDLDRRILDAASQSIDQIRSQIEEKTAIDLKGDIAKQLGKRILANASKIKDSLTTEELKKVSRKIKPAVAKAKKKRPRVAKRPVKH